MVKGRCFNEKLLFLFFFQMHSWEMMSAHSAFDQTWSGVPIKAEPVDDESFEQRATTMMFDHTGVGSLNFQAHPLGFNPLTPPGYPIVHHLQRPSTPCTTTAFSSQSLTPNNTPPMDVTPPKSSKDSGDTPEKETGSECGDSYDGGSDLEEGDIRTPKVNSHGKIKTYKCKQCGFVAVTKVTFWEHTKAHIKPEKMLACPKCPFVTEYKHHLEYHMRNHQRSKPFQCPKCSYSCVNKSMLNSHLKSHSSVFQYRCADCSYATKYCHSLKLHLRKYTHKPDVVLNQDGTPNPLPIIDVYGTRRGPKQKSKRNSSDDQEKPQQTQQQQVKPESSASESTSPLPPTAATNSLANIFQNPPALFPYLNLNLHMFAAQRMAQNIEDTSPQPEALNLVKEPTPEPPKTPKHRRKGRAFKLLDRSLDTMETNTSEYHQSTSDSPVVVSTTKESHHHPKTPSPTLSNTKTKTHSFECKFCDIAFKDDVLYTIHMGYHGYNDVFKCNMCGEKCDDRVSFFLHIARSSHT